MAQQLFSDIPKTASNIPGMVTPNISADIQPNVDWAAVYALQQRMKADRANDWARAAAINNARAARPNQEVNLPSTASQTSGMGAQNAPGQGAVLWAPRNKTGAQLGTWASQQQQQAVSENRAPPVILQAHTGDPYSPGEVGGGMPASVLGNGIFGPGLTSPLGAANPYGAVKSLLGGGGSVGRTKKGKAPDVFPEESLGERTRTSSGPQYQYDMFGGR
jgi:hypothetical protein